MTAEALHQRLAAATALAAVAAFALATRFGAPAVLPVALALLVGLVRRPPARWAARLERIALVLAAALTVRALYHFLFLTDDAVLPMADILLVLVAVEGVRGPGDARDGRLLALSFALLLAGTAYRPGAGFGLALVAFVVLTTLALTVGNVLRVAGSHGQPPMRVERALLVRLGTLSSVVIAAGVGLFLVFPRVSSGWAARSVATQRVIGFGDEVALDAFGGRLVGNSDVVLRVEFPDGRPPNFRDLHWKGRTFDHFDGVRWSHTRGLAAAYGPEDGYAAAWPRAIVRQVIYLRPLDAPVLFALHPVLEIAARPPARVRAGPSGDLSYRGSAPAVYVATSLRDAPPPQLLRTSPEHGAGPAHGAFLQLPPLSARVRRLADSLVAGQPTRYDRVNAVARYLQTRFRYTQQLPATPEDATLEAFLFRRRAGHCEYFSTAMAVLLRAEGIPTRNVGGFLGGEWNDVGGYLVVSQDRAHSWVEVWFPDFGWVSFDPTPAAPAGAATTTAPWVGSLQQFLDAAEHRWGKWVLDYDLDAQLDLAHRAVQAFTGAPTHGTRSGGATHRPIWPLAAALLVFAALLRWPFRRVGAAAAESSRLYVKLRREYARAGFACERERTPLAFALALETARAPGAVRAAALVRAYVRSRFGGERLTEDEEERMRADLAVVRRALHAARRRSGASTVGPADPAYAGGAAAPPPAAS